MDKHAKIFAPNRYCNSEESLSDPLNGVSLGNKMLQFAKSSQVAGLPLAAQVTPFATSSGAYRVSVSATLPASRMQRQWDGLSLRTSIAVLGLVYDDHNLLVYRFSDVACLPRETLTMTVLCKHLALLRRGLWQEPSNYLRSW